MGIGRRPDPGDLSPLMVRQGRPAVFLDRDGVLIDTAVRDGKPYAITETEPVTVLDGVLEACTELRAAGFLLVLVTNQPDVARGQTRVDFVERTNADLAAMLGLDDVRVCYHQDSDHCNCRKPKPGLLTRAATEMSVDLSASFMVGDRWRDIEAGRNAGCKTVLIERAYREPRAEAPDHTAHSLLDTVPWIIACSRKPEGYRS